MIKAVRGTRDLLPPATALWILVESAVRVGFLPYNFHEIRTPIFENTELFARGVGEETDVVSKEMYTWQDPPGLFEEFRESYREVTAALKEGRQPSGKLVSLEILAGQQSLTLRPENTAGVVRAY